MWKCVCGEVSEDKYNYCCNCSRDKSGKLKSKKNFTSTINDVDDYMTETDDFTSSRTIKDELILNEWSMIIDHGAGEEIALINDIKQLLDDASIPGDCDWSLQEVKSKGILSRVKREFLVVHLDQFRDYHMYIGAREYGIHLDCCWFLTVEPSIFKKWASKKLTGFIDSYSMPKNILLHQDLRAWNTVVHHCVLEAVQTVVLRLGKNQSVLHRRSKGFMDIW